MSSKRIITSSPRVERFLSAEDEQLFEAAWETTRMNHGHGFTFYLPGMIKYGKVRGHYPAISITGCQCELQCEHCRGKLLEPMIKITDPDELVKISLRFANNGAHGLLLTGGSNQKGRLPWERFEGAIRKIREETSLFISAHTGFPGHRSSTLLKEAGVNQALIDLMGDERTATRVYHLNGLKPLFHALEGIKQSGLEFIPHLVAGLYYGDIKAEYMALDFIRRYNPEALVIVVLTPLKGTPMARVLPPSPIEIGRLIARARLLMPEVPISLGCERPRNREGWSMERLAIRAGATRMAVWSEEAIYEAEGLGLTLNFQSTCCSLNYTPKFSTTPW